VIVSRKERERLVKINYRYINRLEHVNFEHMHSSLCVVNTAKKDPTLSRFDSSIGSSKRRFVASITYGWGFP
jgi:hypothetical protein